MARVNSRLACGGRKKFACGGRPKAFWGAAVGSVLSTIGSAINARNANDAYEEYMRKQTLQNTIQNNQQQANLINSALQSNRNMQAAYQNEFENSIRYRCGGRKKAKFGWGNLFSSLGSLANVSQGFIGNNSNGLNNIYADPLSPTGLSKDIGYSLNPKFTGGQGIATFSTPVNPIQQIQYRCGGRKKARNGRSTRLSSPYITDGGVGIPLGNGLTLLRGATHDDTNETGQTGIGIQVGRHQIEAENGEVAQRKNKELRIFSDQPMFNGVSPADAVQAGYNPDEIFAAQELYKRMAGLKDDGTTYAIGGDTDDSSISRRILKSWKDALFPFLSSNNRTSNNRTSNNNGTNRTRQQRNNRQQRNSRQQISPKAGPGTPVTPDFMKRGLENLGINPYDDYYADIIRPADIKSNYVPRGFRREVDYTTNWPVPYLVWEGINTNNTTSSTSRNTANSTSTNNNTRRNTNTINNNTTRSRNNNSRNTTRSTNRNANRSRRLNNRNRLRDITRFNAPLYIPTTDRTTTIEPRYYREYTPEEITNLASEISQIPQERRLSKDESFRLTRDLNRIEYLNSKRKRSKLGSTTPVEGKRRKYPNGGSDYWYNYTNGFLDAIRPRRVVDNRPIWQRSLLSYDPNNTLNNTSSASTSAINDVTLPEIVVTPNSATANGVTYYNNNDINNAALARATARSNWQDRYGMDIRNSDWIGLGTDLLGSIGTGLINGLALRDINVDYTIPQYVDETPVAFDTTWHNGAQRANVERNRINIRNTIGRNTASSNTAVQRMQAADTSAMMQQNELWDEKANKEAELRNAAATNEQQVRARNAAARNAYYQQVAEIRNAEQDANNALRLARGQALNTTLQGIAGAANNFLNQTTQRYEDNQALLATMVAGQPGSVARMLASGYGDNALAYRLYRMNNANAVDRPVAPNQSDYDLTTESGRQAYNSALQLYNTALIPYNDYSAIRNLALARINGSYRLGGKINRKKLSCMR